MPAIKRKHTNIHIERARYNLTQDELAEKVGVSRQAIHLIENGKVVAGTSLAIKIAVFFKTTVEDLFKID